MRQCPGVVILLSIVVFTLTVSLSGDSYAGIVGSKHDFTVDNLASDFRFNTNEVCYFCHTPHHARASTPVLWNRSYVSDPGTFQLYTSFTFDGVQDFAGTGNNMSSSLLCMGCHDGTTAINAIIMNPTDSDVNTEAPQLIPDTRFTNLGQDLRNDHPVGFIYDDALVDTDRINGGHSVDQLVKPGVDGIIDDGVNKILLYGRDRNRLECRTCHDPHDNSNGMFLVKSNDSSQLCRSCHLQ